MHLAQLELEMPCKGKCPTEILRKTMTSMSPKWRKQINKHVHTHAHTHTS